MTVRDTRVRVCALIVVICSAGSGVGCAAIERTLGIPWFERESSQSPPRIGRDIAYRAGAGADPKIHRLDIHVPGTDSLPEGTRWPVLVVLRGDAPPSADGTATSAAPDAYESIGRFFASHGVGVVIVRHRSAPEASWGEQVEDVGRAVRWAEDHVERWGGNPSAIFLSGEAAGAMLAARFGLAPIARLDAGVNLCGLILVSGIDYDKSDEPSLTAGENRTYFEEPFVEETGEWETWASALQLVQQDSPPALIVYSSGGSENAMRQSQLLANAYAKSGARAWKVSVPGAGQERVFETLRLDARSAGPTMLGFIRGRTESCAEPLLF